MTEWFPTEKVDYSHLKKRIHRFGDQSMIPVLIAPAFNRHDLLLRALTSIDIPVERGLVIDSGINIERAPEWPEILDQMERLNLVLFTPPFISMGYGGSINYTIMQTADSPWWLWISNDIQFEPGFLATVSERMYDNVARPRVVTGGFTWGAVNRATINTVGLIDEHSFHPIYFDDNDFAHRCRLAGVDWIEEGLHGITHGDGKHEASLTILSDDKVREANNGTFSQNQDAYVAKWGGVPGKESHPTPWNSGLPVWATKPDVDGRRDRRW